jgi:hypothetical protein
MIMADYEQLAADLNEAAAICEKHQMDRIPGQTYPRWPEAWEACEIVWRNYLDMQTIKSDQDLDDRATVNEEARKLGGRQE